MKRSIIKLLKNAGFQKAPTKREKWVHANGWWVRGNSKTIYIGPKHDRQFKHVIDGIPAAEFDAVGRLPAAAKLRVFEHIFNNMAATPTGQLLNKKKKEERARRRAARKLKPKRPWCAGCQICPEGEDSAKCSKLAYTAEYAHWYCTDDRTYSRLWCANAGIVRGDHPSKFYMHCEIRNRPCDYNTSYLHWRAYPCYNKVGEHYTTCSDYVKPQ